MIPNVEFAVVIPLSDGRYHAGYFCHSLSYAIERIGNRAFVDPGVARVSHIKRIRIYTALACFREALLALVNFSSDLNGLVIHGNSLDFAAFLNGERDAFCYIVSLGRLRLGECIRSWRKRFNPMGLSGRSPFIDDSSVGIGDGKMRAGKLAFVGDISF